MVDGLAQGRLDLAITVNQQPDDRIELIPLFDDPWVILTRRDNELAAADRPSFDMLDSADVVAWTSRWTIQTELEAAWRRRGINPRVVYRTDDNLVLQRLVAAGLGHACVGRLAAQRAIDPSLTWLGPPDVLSTRTVALCHPRRRDLAEAARGRSSAASEPSALCARVRLVVSHQLPGHQGTKQAAHRATQPKIPDETADRRKERVRWLVGSTLIRAFCCTPGSRSPRITMRRAVTASGCIASTTTTTTLGSTAIR
jgi:hypothetical protein